MEAPDTVLIHDARRAHWLLFQHPLETVAVHTPREVMEKLQYVEAAVEKRGLHAAGLVSYEAALAFDDACKVKADREFPLLWFGLYEAPRRVELPPVPEKSTGLSIPWEKSLTPEQYAAGFRRIKHYIQEGHTYQVNYTYRLRADTAGIEPWSLFLRLLAAQEPQYGAFVNTGDWSICSASPELFFRLDGDRIESRPMKGTAGRGLTYHQDVAEATWLQQSEKNRAENIMIVDMVRNDLGRIAEISSITVDELCEVERYPTVWQMTSTVSARTQANLVDIFRALFPAASITGAPKVRTMEIIRELETSPRRIYTGAIGFMAPGRYAQFNVAIRTLLIDKKRARAEFGVGGGIVWDSEPDLEQGEARTKARILEHPVEPFRLLESLRWTPSGGFWLLERHLTRLGQSAEYFRFTLNSEAVRRRLNALAQTLPPVPHKVRILVDKAGGIKCRAEPVNLSALSGLVELGLAASPVNRSDPFLYHKTTRRQVYEQARAENPDYRDVLLYNQEGEVTETTIANIAVEMDGELWTPPVSSGLLPGTCRDLLLKRKHIRDRVMTIDQIRNCATIYLMNSVRGLYRGRIAEAPQEIAEQNICSGG